jgi:tetratricopeptide (TPR) repeat protein
VDRRGLQVRLGLCLAASAAIAASAPQPSSLGRLVFPTSGSAAAQPAFIRGVLLLHSFEYDDAIEAFREAERVDPAFALAYWGEAMCFNQPLWFNENVEKARDALRRLEKALAARPVGAREQGYIDAVRRLFAGGDKAARDRAYADRMGDLWRSHPGDDEAGAFYALALLATIPPGRPDAAVSLQAGGIASRILARNPRHPGAAHYALHAYGDGEHAAMGLTAARAYARIAPASSHARHMPSHVFLPLGLWDEAAASDESAYAASVEWVKRRHASPAQEDFHSLSWLQYEYLQQGRFAKAAELLAPVERAIAAAPGTGAHPHVESEIGRGFASPALKSELASLRARLVVESGRWPDMKGRGTFDNVDELFALGLASAKLGDRTRASAVLEHFAKAIDAAPDADNRQLAEIMRLELTGVAAAGAGDRAGALAALERAARLEAGRPRPNARPYPIKPAVELYAEALLDAGDARAAVGQFRASLKRTPRRAASLIGLASAEHMAGMRADAVKTAREFLEMWRRADSGRPEIARARAIVTPP